MKLLMQAVRVRAADEWDMEGLLRIEQECFGVEKFNAETVRAFVVRDDAFVLLAIDEEEIVGSAMCMISDIGMEGKIASIAVLKKCRGSGVGSLLLDECEKVFQSHGLTKYTLEVDVMNKPAISLYVSRGYETKASIQDFYGAGRPAYIMEKKLGPSRIEVRSA
jgi:ribosomal protein S18 acetylase RimI-like enzyme